MFPFTIRIGIAGLCVYLFRALWGELPLPLADAAPSDDASTGDLILYHFEKWGMDAFCYSWLMFGVLGLIVALSPIIKAWSGKYANLGECRSLFPFQGTHQYLNCAMTVYFSSLLYHNGGHFHTPHMGLYLCHIQRPQLPLFHRIFIRKTIQTSCGPSFLASGILTALAYDFLGTIVGICGSSHTIRLHWVSKNVPK